MIKLILLLAAIPVVLIGSVRLGIRIVRWVRLNRGEVTLLGVGEEVRGWIADSLESFATPDSGHSDGVGEHADASDHHHHHHHHD